jgi:8-oxo-dGTP diphosphatase
LNGTTTVSKTVDGGSIPSAPAKGKPLRWFFSFMKPIQLILTDTQFSFQGIKEIRPNARAMLYRKDGRFAFNHILATDRFGQRNYLETLGGGLDVHETPEQAVVREVEEESGLKAKIITKIGLIQDTYHLIQRENHNHYFLMHVHGQGQQQWTAQEHHLIHQLLWLTLDEARAWYNRLPNQGIAQLIKQRELPVLDWVETFLNDPSESALLYGDKLVR